MENFNEYFPQHSYYLFSVGTSLKSKRYSTRAEAEHVMYRYCAKHGIMIELVEDDKHEKMYKDDKGVEFYINRVR